MLRKIRSCLRFTKHTRENLSDLNNNQDGNIFFMLFGAVAIVGLLGTAVMSTMRGPLSTMVEIQSRTQAESEMAIASHLALLEATELANAGDCDNDGFVEPLEFADAGGLGPVGGGFLPNTVASSRVDPWGTEYGYCAWDAGSTSNAIGCDIDSSGTNDRLDGNGSPTDETYTVIAIVSAGPDQVFGTTCTGGANPSIAKTGDDIVVEFTYASANAASNGLWNLKSGDPTTAEISKNLEITGTAAFSANASFGAGIDLSASTAALQLGAASMLFPNEATLTTCNGANVGLIRINTGADPDFLELCDASNGWVAIGGNLLWSAGASNDIYYNAGATPQVGIGKTNPSEALDVDGNIDVSGNLDAGGDLIAGGNAAITGTLDVTGATTLSTLNASGAVDFASTLNVTGLITGTSGIYIRNTDTSFAVNTAGHYTGDYRFQVPSGTTRNITFRHTSGGWNAAKIEVSKLSGSNHDGTMHLYTTGHGNSQLFLDELGNVGIGTTSPNAQLHVSGSTILTSTLNAQGTISNSTGNVSIGDNLDVSGDLDVTGDIDATDITASSDLNAGSTINVNGDQLGPALNCSSSQKLEWNNGSGWSCVTDLQGGGSGGIPALDDLTDVGVSTPADGECLVYDNSSGEWENAPCIGTGAGIFEIVSNVTRVKSTAGDYTNDDFVFGSPQLDDDGDTNHDNRMFFDKSKGAFRAGGVTSAEWDDANIGTYSFAIGLHNTASGSESFAGGWDSTASGFAAFAWGNGATANGHTNVAIGEDVATSGGDRAFAFGQSVTTTGSRSFSFGLGNTAGVNPRVSAPESFGIFMGDQSGVDLSVSNRMGLYGGDLLIDDDGTTGSQGCIQYNGTTSELEFSDDCTTFTAFSDGSLGLWTDLTGGRIHYGTTSANQVGVGTSNPQTTLDVNGGIRVGSVSGSAAPTFMAINDLSDVAAAAPSNSDCLVYNNASSNWENVACSSLGGASNIFEVTGGAGSEVVSSVDANAPYTTADFVFGSPQLDDDGDTNHDSRMFFDKSKGAFRVGSASNTQWDDANVGNGSIALGANATASGLRSTALGNKAVASGHYSSVLGSASTADGKSSTAIGHNVTVTGDESVGIGVGDASGANPIISGTSSLGIFMGDNTGYDLTTDNRMALIGGDLMIDDDGSAGSQGCIRYLEGTGLQYSDDCSTFSSFTSLGGAGAINDLSDGITYAASVFLGGDSGRVSTGDHNTALGDDTLYTNTTGTRNTAIGSNSMWTNNGSYNTAVGVATMYNSTTGDNNSVLGYRIMFGGSTGSDNTVMGYMAANTLDGDNNVMLGSGAGEITAAADDNVFIGYQTANNNTTGARNIIIGANADNLTASTDDYINIGNTIFGDMGTNPTTPGTGDADITIDGDLTVTGTISGGVGGLSYPLDIEGETVIMEIGTGNIPVFVNANANNNLFVGQAAGSAVTPDAPSAGDGKWNTFVGINAGATTTTGKDNAFFGYGAGEDNIGGSYNTVLGSGAGTANTIGNNNVYLGYHTGRENIDGVDNVIIGREALKYATSTSSVVAIGFRAGLYATAGANTLIGYQAGQAANGAELTGIDNTFIGTQSGLVNTSGADNTFIGDTAGVANTTGYRNTFVGSSAGVANTTGLYNTATGYLALSSNLAGAYNTAYGMEALRETTSGGNSAFGTYSAVSTTSGSYNVSFGNGALAYNESGNDNVVLGAQAGSGVASGSNIDGNILLGRRTGEALLTGGSYNVMIGYKSGDLTTTGARNILIGSDVANLTPTTNDYINIGNTIFGDMGTNPTTPGTGDADITIDGDLTVTGTISGGTALSLPIDVEGETVIMEIGTGNIPVLVNAFANDNLFLGQGAGASVTPDTPSSGDGERNTFFGQSAGTANTSGQHNTYIGFEAGDANTIGDGNTAIGSDAGGANITGGNNVYVGSGAGLLGTSASDQTIIGAGAGVFNNGRGSTFYGSFAGYNNTGDNSVVIGTHAGDQSATASDIVLIGDRAGRYATADSNTLIGYQSGMAASGSELTGTDNTFVGYQTGLVTTSGADNTFIGDSAGIANTTGGSNIFIGSGAGTANIDGASNTFIGTNAGDAAISADSNTFVGDAAGGSTTTGNSNTFIGAFAGSANTTAQQNTALGFYAGNSNQTSTGNAFFGAFAGRLATSVNNTMVGTSAGSAVTTGPDNTFLGRSAGGSTTTGGYNVFLGESAGSDNTTGRVNILIGEDIEKASGSISSNWELNIGNVIYGTMGTSDAEYSATADSSAVITIDGDVTITGTCTGCAGAPSLPIDADAATSPAGQIISINTGSDNFLFYNNTNYNLALGTAGGNAITSGAGNTFLGIETGEANTTGDANTFIGVQAGEAITVESNNTFLGAGAGQFTTTGSNNTFLGYDSGQYSTTGNNTLIGYQSGKAANGSELTGTDNTFVGYQTGLVTTSGADNTFLGDVAGRANTTGLKNTFVGADAGLANTTGDSNAFFGEGAGDSNEGGSDNVFIGQDAGGANVSGSRNTFIGDAVGISGASGDDNVVIGHLTARYNTGSDSVIIGRAAAGVTTGVNRLVAIGYESGQNTTGVSNTFMGYQSGRINVAGQNNTYLGYQTGEGATGSDNTFVGTDAGVNTTGGSNVFFGKDTGQNNLGGASNTFIGEESGELNSTGSDNVFLGQNAGNLNLTGSRNIIVGSNIQNLTNATDDYLNIGDVIIGDMTTGNIQVVGTAALTNPSGTTAQRPSTGVNGMIRYNSTLNQFEGYENGSWVSMGDNVSAAGADTEIQFNNAGAMGASDQLNLRNAAGTQKIFLGDMDVDEVVINHSTGIGYSGTLNVFNNNSSFKGAIHTANSSYSSPTNKNFQYGLINVTNRDANWDSSPVALQQGDYLAGIGFAGMTSTSLGSSVALGAAIHGYVDNTVSSSVLPTSLVFSTATTNSLAERMIISSLGDITMSSTGALTIHSGLSAQRPSTGVNGMIRYNSTLSKFEAYENSGWINMIGSAGGLWTDNTTHISRSNFHVLNTSLAAGSTTAGLDGNGTYSFYDPDKGAMRGGAISGGNAAWEDTNIGTNSFAWGLNAQASGPTSFAIGTGNVASGDVSLAVGDSSVASGNYSTAIGALATASGDFSTAIGIGASAIGANSTALGIRASASGEGAMAFGLTTVANNPATAPIVSGDESFGIFMGNQSGIDITDNNTMAILGGDFIVGSYQFGDTTTGTQDSRMFFDRSSGAFRAGTTAGTQWNSANVGANSTALGANTTASGDGSMAIGGDTTASGENSTAIGDSATASGDVSTAIGDSTTASGAVSIAIGEGTTASGDVSAAWGVDTIASGYTSVTWGQETIASGENSVAIGRETSAGSGTAGDGDGDNSFAIGLQSATQTTNPIITGDRSMVLYMDGGVANANSAYDFTASDKFAIIGGEFQIDDVSSSANKGCIRYNSATTKIQYSHDCSTFSDMGGGGGGGGAINDLSDAYTDYTTDNNMFIGSGAGAAIASGGTQNLFIGESSGALVTTSDGNTAVGFETLDVNTSGEYQAAFGSGTLTNNTTGTKNAAFGASAMFYNTDGSNNVALGHLAGRGNSGGASPENSAFIGYYSGLNITTGINNTLLGYNTGATLTTGGNNILIGASTNVPTSSTSNHLNIGNTIYGDLANDYVGIGNSAPDAALDVTGDIEYTGTLTDVSDRRLKDNIKPLGQTLDRIAQIDTYSFTMKDDKKGRTEFGVMAQELEEIFPTLVHTAKDEIGTKSVNYVGLIAPMIEATKELRAENAALKAELSGVKTAQAQTTQALTELSQQVALLNKMAGNNVGKASMMPYFMLLFGLLGGMGFMLLIQRKQQR